jgi:hypothetical protein
MSITAGSETPFNHAVHWRFQAPNERQNSKGAVRVSFELVDETGAVLSCMKMPIAELHELLRPHLTPTVDLYLDGTLSAEVEVTATPGQSPLHIELLQLLSRALEPAMLEDEPEVKQRLTGLKSQLTESLALVNRTLADFAEDQS